MWGHVIRHVIHRGHICGYLFLYGSGAAVDVLYSVVVRGVVNFMGPSLFWVTSLSWVPVFSVFSKESRNSTSICLIGG